MEPRPGDGPLSFHRGRRQSRHLAGLLDRETAEVPKFHEATLCRHACVIDQDAAHQLRRDPEELRASLPLYPIQIDQFQIRLMNECRGLKDVARPLAAHVTRRDSSQLVLHGWEKRFERVAVAVAPRQEELGDFASVVHFACRAEYTSPT